MRKICFFILLLASLSSLAWGEGLGVSYMHAMEGLTDAFPMRIFPGAEPRYFGTAEGGLVTLMLTGQPSDLSKAVFVVNYIYRNEGIAQRTTLLAGQFLRNFAPAIDKPFDYLTEILTMMKAPHTFYQPQTLREGDKSLEFLFVPSVGQLSITITPAEASQ